MTPYKLVDEISLNFRELFIIRKFLKIRIKNRGSSYYFLSSGSKKIKNFTKIEQERLFLFTFLVSFSMVFLARKLIYTINDLILCLAHCLNKIYKTYAKSKSIFVFQKETITVSAYFYYETIAHCNCMIPP